MKLTKIIPVKWVNEGHDSDLDGTPNYRDCEIFNPRKHASKDYIKRWHVKKTWYPKAKITGEDRERQTDEFLRLQEKGDIDIVAQQMFGKYFFQLTSEEKEEARRAFIWGW